MLQIREFFPHWGMAAMVWNQIQRTALALP